MPIKKRQRLADGGGSSVKPTSASSATSTRSRTRSASLAPAAAAAAAASSTATPPASRKGKRKQPERHQASPLRRGKEDATPRLSPVWHADPAAHVECWVEIPPLPVDSFEDQLLFVRPRTTQIASTDKRKQSVGALVRRIERDAELDPFHFSETDLSAKSDVPPFFALRLASSTSKQKPLPASSSVVDDQPGAQSSPLVLNPRTSPGVQPASDGLEDLFLRSHAGPSTESVPPQEHAAGAPLFFHGHSDDEDARRNDRPARKSQPTSPPDAKLAATIDDSAVKLRISPASGLASATKQRSQQASPSASSSAHDKRSRKAADKARVEDVDNLRSELNEEAFARSTGPRHKEEFHSKLAAFAQARRKAKLQRGESVSDSASDDDRVAVKNARNATTDSSGTRTSSSESDDSDDSDDSDSESSGAFVVGDNEIEYDEGFGPDDAPSSPRARTRASPAAAALDARTIKDRKRYQRDADGRIRLMPIHSQAAAAATGSSVLAAHGLGPVGARRGLEELCLDWLEWAVARVLVTWSSLSSPDRERLERNRAALKSRMRSTEESVGSVAMRRQFKWYLTQYPKLQIEALFSDELERFGSLAKQGCGVCHRRSQKPQARVVFSGKRYNQQSLAPLKSPKHVDSDASDPRSDSDSSDEDEAASDRSSDTETWREEAKDAAGRPGHVFFAGNHCAQRAAVMHALRHWEWLTMQTLARHESIRYVRRQLWRKSRAGRGKDGQLGAGAYEVAFCIAEMVRPSGRCNWKNKPADARPKHAPSELDRLVRRLKSLSDQAIRVNRAK